MVMRVLRFLWKCLRMLYHSGGELQCDRSNGIDSHRWENKIETQRHVSKGHS